MASGRSVAARAKLLYQHKRAVPSLSRRVHSNDDDHEKPKPKRPTPSSYSQGSFLEGRNDFRKFHGSRSLLFQDGRFMAPATCGSISVRNMSSTGVGSSNKIGIMSDVIDYHTDNTVELVSQAYSMSPEVAEAAVDSFYPVRGLMYLFDYVHFSTGLSWWLTIAGVTLLIRLLQVPFAIHDVGNLKHGISGLNLVKRILVKGLIFWTFFFAIKNMAEKVPSFKEGGTLWFTDLSTPDSLYIFPVLTALTCSIVLQVRFHLNAQGMEDSADPGMVKVFPRILAVLTIPFTASVPKAMFCYWITTHLFWTAFGIVIMKPEVRKWLDMPGIPVTSPPSNGVNSDFFITGVIKKYVDDLQKFGATGSQLSSAPPAEESTKTVTRRIPGLSILNQRIKILEKRIKILEKEGKGRKK